MKLVGCSDTDLRAHIERLFTDGPRGRMTWENYGRGSWKHEIGDVSDGYDWWELDHMIPFAAFDLSIERNQRIVMWYLNTQPLWRKDNREKSATFTKIDKLALMQRYRIAHAST